MSISYVLVLLGLGVFGCAVWAMFWAIEDGQYDAAEENGDIPDLLAKGDGPRSEVSPNVPPEVRSEA
jgi:nitrogen fixation-related uncharacterized protein